MKLGTENRNKVIAAGALGVLALLLVARALIGPGSSEPGTSVAASVPSPTTVPAVKRSAGKVKPKIRKGPPHSLDPELRYDWLKASEDTQYSGQGRNIFSAQAAIPEPLKNGTTDAKNNAPEDTGPPPPPPPPPINLKFFGFASKPGEPKKVFLSQGEDVFIAAEGEIVNRRYKVVRISPVAVEIEDEMNSHKQSIPLTSG